MSVSGTPLPTGAPDVVGSLILVVCARAADETPEGRKITARRLLVAPLMLSLSPAETFRVSYVITVFAPCPLSRKP